MPPSSPDDCGECLPDYLRHSAFPGPRQLFSYLAFLVTFLVAAVLVAIRLVPNLTGGSNAYEKRQEREQKRSLRHTTITSRAATAACATTIGLSAVLVHLLLCEISGLLDKEARSTALRATLVSLTGLIVAVVPALEVWSTIGSCLGHDRHAAHGRHSPLRIVMSILVLWVWLVGFWYLPYASLIPNSDVRKSRKPSWMGRRQAEQNRTDMFLIGCLERIAIVGIALMAALAGFAAVSAIWTTLGRRQRIVKDSDIARKRSGLDSVRGMLDTKMSRIRALEAKMTQSGGTATQQGFIARLAGSFKGDGETQERKALELEITGLETMAAALEESLASLQSTMATQKRSETLLGRMTNAAGVAFAIYCLYRLATVSVSIIRRIAFHETSKASTDPISNFLALLTSHYDEKLNYEAWSRQISFAMSGVILMLSFSAVLQTFRLFARLMPSLLQRVRTSLPLAISQISGTYVISSALMLRSNLPPEARGAITDALGSPIDARFADSWFEGWFLVAAGLSIGGIVISRKLAGDRDWDDWDDAGDLEMGKMS